jgi:DNA-3-methyladenine glycosylase I
MILKNSHSNNTISSQPSVYINRCEWVPHDKDFYIAYHDEEWGIPVHDDPKHFEMLTLEGAQAGLNWETILKKRKAYQATFYNFDPKKVALMTDQATP